MVLHEGHLGVPRHRRWVCWVHGLPIKKQVPPFLRLAEAETGCIVALTCSAVLRDANEGDRDLKQGNGIQKKNGFRGRGRGF